MKSFWFECRQLIGLGLFTLALAILPVGKFRDEMQAALVPALSDDIDRLKSDMQ